MMGAARNVVLELQQSIAGPELSRRALLRRGVALGLAAPAVASLLAACAEDDSDDDTEPVDEDDADEPMEPVDDPDDDMTDDEEIVEEEPDDDEEDVAAPDDEDDRYGGELRVAIRNEPPTFDFHLTSSTETFHVVMHIFETLFTWDEDFQLVPELVDTWEVADDGLLNTLHLRQGVLFHNGDELTAEDVTATVDRWANVIGVGFGEQLMAATEEMRIVDDYTIEFEMSEPFGTFGVVLARQNNGCTIYPKEVAEAAGTDPIEDLIGTGPYKFADYQPDRHFVMERFEDYSYRDEPSSGYAGRKYAYLDTIRILPVTDEGARISGLRADEYDFSTDTSADQYDTLDADDMVVGFVGPANSNDHILLNMEEGITLNHDLRKAIQAAVDCEEILVAAHGEGFYDLQPSHMWSGTIWHSTAGEELYNIGDPDLAGQYLEDAGYDGEVIRILVSQQWEPSFNTAMVLQQHLQDAGMETDVQAVDASAYADIRNDMTGWEIAITFFNFRVDPAQLPTQRCEWGNRWCTDRKVELVDRLFREVEFEDRYEAWEDIQALAYEEVSSIKTGDGRPLIAYHSRLQDVDLVRFAYAFWNVWIQE
jgi:peptide/nickel transport system substrate-binding protein